MAGITGILKWPPLVTKRTCEWCSSPCWMKDEFPRLCQHPWSQWPADLLLDLQHCEDCVVEYHRIRDDFVKNEPQKKKNLWEGDVERLTLFIRQALWPSDKEVEEVNQTALELLNNFEKAKLNMDNVAQNLQVPLLEILQFPQLLFNTGLAELFLNAVAILIDNGSPLILSDKYPGIYMLLVHPSQKIRKWATKTTQRLTRVSSDDYDMIKDAIQWMVGVITLNMFDNDILLMNEGDVSFSAAYLPPHLCDLKCPLEFWKGFTKLLLRLEGDVLCYKVLGVSGYRDLPDTILNAIENKGSKSLFWSAFTCLVIILERCGPRIWPMVTRQPLRVFNIITSHSHYCEELNRYKQGAQIDEQIEQGGSQCSSSSEIQRGSTNTAIGWFQPFVVSVLDYGEVAVDCVTEVIRFLDILSGHSRKREIIFKLCNIVSRVVYSGRMSSLLPTADIWVTHIVKLSSLDVKNQEVFRNIVLPAQEIIASICTKTEDKAARAHLKELDFTKLKSETERQHLIEMLLNHLKGTVKRNPKRKKETSFSTKTKDGTYCIRKSKNYHILSEPPQAVDEGTQTNGRYKESSTQKDLKSAERTTSRTKLKTSPPSLSTCANTNPDVTAEFSVTPSESTIVSSTTSLSKTDKTAANTDVLDKTFSKLMSASDIQSTASRKGIDGALSNELPKNIGSSKANPISLDSDEDVVQSDTENTEERYLTPDRKGVKEEKRDPSHSPCTLAGSPESQQFSIFRHRSLEKSIDRLNRIRITESPLDNSYVNASSSKADSQAKTSPSIAASLFTAAQYTSDSASNLVNGGNTSLSASSNDSLSAFPERSNRYAKLGKEKVNKKRFRKHKNRAQAIDESGSSDETVSLEESEDNEMTCRRKGKKLRKKRSAEKRNLPTDLKCSDETESLEELKDGNQSEIDSDEPLDNLLTSKKDQQTVASTSISNNCNEIMAKNKKCASSSSGVITLNSKRLRKIREMFKDPKSKNKAPEVPRTDEKSKVSSPEAESLVLDDLIILESETCTDDKAPRISGVGQVENLPFLTIELDKSQRNINAENSGKLPAKQQGTKACSNGKLASECNTISSVSSVKDSTTIAVGSSIKQVNDTQLDHDTRERVKEEGMSKSTATTSKQENVGDYEIPLNDISEALENDGEFNDSDWYKQYEDELLLSEEEEDIQEIESEKPDVLETDGELSDVQWFASSRNRPSLSGERKGKSTQEQQGCEMTSLLGDAPLEELTDEELCAALKNHEQKKSCQELSSLLDKEDDRNKQNLTFDKLSEAHTLRKWENLKGKENEAVDEIHYITRKTKDELTAEGSGSSISQESIETESRVANLIAQMDNKYGDISSDSNEECVNTAKKDVVPHSEQTEGDAEMKEMLFSEDLDTEDLWEDCDWDDTSAMCSQGSVIDSIVEDTESLSSDEEHTDKNQDRFLGQGAANLDANDFAQSENVSEAQDKTPPFPTHNPVVPSRTMIPDSVSDTRTQKDPFHEKPAVVGSSPVFKPDAMYERILSWRVSWLDARREKIDLYSNLERMEKLPKTFDSMTDYCRNFAPILAVEAFEQAIKEWKESTKKAITAFVKNAIVSHKYTAITAVTMNVGHFAVTNRTLPEESELVILTCDGAQIFGLVDKVEQEVVRESVSSSTDGGSNEKTYNVKFAIRTSRTTNFRPPESSKLEIKVVASLLTTLRKWCGLVNFHQSLLARDILRPRGQRYFCQFEIPKQVTPSKVYNESQSRVIQTAAEAVHQAYTLPRICLVQGPPGTGKSHTIVGIVSSILNHPKALETSQVHSELFSEKPKILLCAPSNEAIDELVRKFIREKPRRENMESSKENRKTGDRNVRGDNYKNCGDFSVIRVGRKSKISESVKHLSLESMTRREMAKRNSGPQEHTVCNIREQLKMIEERIDSIERKKYILSKEETATATEENLKETKLQELQNEKSSLISQKKDLERIYRSQREKEQGQRRMETRIKKEILNSADVICTTLSGSGSTSLLNDLRGVNGKKIPFSCVIVDEACQCCELDVLIPLQYHSTKLILVGDPEQLSATVISRDAKHLLYGRSMFDRLYRVFKPIRRNERPVHLLSTQYRMHPEIAHFPSKHFYNDNIHTDSSLAKRVFPVKFPYALFDVHRGRETNDNGGSISNAQEARLVSSICHFLVVNLGLHPSDIGIITPYRTQRAKLQALLSDGCREIEVKTVDGFQGGEKNVIVMSCVRTGGNIGFLDDTNRLNVALTRARHALFMFGHMNTLKNFRGWGDLLKDGDSRKLVFPVDSGQDVIQVISKGNPPPLTFNSVQLHDPLQSSIGSGKTPHGENNHPVPFHRSVSLVESRPTCTETSPKYLRTHSLEEPSLLNASNQSINKELTPNQLQNESNAATNSEEATLPSRTDENRTGNQNSLFDRLRKNIKDSSESSDVDNQKNPIIENGGKSNSSQTILKSSLKRPLVDKDIADKPAKKFRFGTVEINTDGTCHSYALHDHEAEKRVSPGHLQKCRDNVERAPPGGLQYRKLDKTGKQVDGSRRNMRKSSDPNRHSRREKTSAADMGHDNRDIRREFNKTNGSTRDKAEVPSHLDKDLSSTVNMNVVGDQEHGIAAGSSNSMPVYNGRTRDEKKLNEAVNRVREGQPLQRRPVVIETPPGSRGGRGGRLRVPSHVPDEARTGQPTPFLENWKPHGGPRNRTAQSNSSDVQNMRLRAVQPTISNNSHKSRAQKRTQPRLRDIHPKKRRK